MSNKKEIFRDEFINHVKEIGKDIDCVYLDRIHGSDIQLRSKFLLCRDYSDDDFNIFLDSLSFKYENYPPIGMKEVSGFILFKDGSFSDRVFSYDGECFEYKDFHVRKQQLIENKGFIKIFTDDDEI